jgi:hypothetical protein
MPQTFLEFVAERLLGPPARTDSMGRSWWHCPFHNDNTPSFNTLPPKKGKKDWFKCLGCGEWGDEHDLLKKVGGVTNYSDRRDQLQQWREDYEDSLRARPAPGPVSLCGLWSRDQDTPSPVAPGQHSFDDHANAALEDLLGLIGDRTIESEVLVLTVMRRTLTICARHQVHAAVLADRCDAELWSRQVELTHLRECTDPNCKYDICRAKRAGPNGQRKGAKHA